MPVSSQAVPRLRSSTESCPRCEIGLVDVGDFKLAPGRRGDALGDGDHRVVVEIETRYGIVGFWCRRFFFDIHHVAVLIEADHAVALGVFHIVAEDRGPLDLPVDVLELCREPFRIEDIVPQDERHRTVADKVFANQERLGQPFRPGLGGIVERDAPLGAVPQKIAEQRQSPGAW